MDDYAVARQFFELIADVDADLVASDTGFCGELAMRLAHLSTAWASEGAEGSSYLDRIEADVIAWVDSVPQAQASFRTATAD